MELARVRLLDSVRLTSTADLKVMVPIIVSVRTCVAFSFIKI